MERIGPKIRELRENHHLSVDDLALKLGIAKSVVWGYESGKKQVSVSHLQLLADYFKVTVDFLLERNQNTNQLDFIQLIDLNSVNLVVDDHPLSKEELADVTSYLQVKRRLKEDDMLQDKKTAK
ncbi:HTH-type transcriptional regulator AnsR [Planococcus halocryophilus Or1]|uniref:Transcriptional regulator n=1 Tax=Planococcus halocryophilus TaxID=1215089 RepID=A0A1C7DQP0_9BACL|nr:helix-turn-helix transcriptional regulator [Planococcus halocryophilus]ANU13919.1 transcriptional regulator [Planococcus halocryophilus]EMF47491.1 HTH-type transcriptional regulator AnsR [Planococcus halocryophilus Or1]